MVKIAIGTFFRSVGRREAGTTTGTVRDRLNEMGSLDLVSSTELWLEMRTVGNRITHDYLPEEIQGIYDGIRLRFAVELARLQEAGNRYVATLAT